MLVALTHVCFRMQSEHAGLHYKCPLMTQSGHSPKLGYASDTFGVRYHETLDCKADAFPTKARIFHAHTKMALSLETLGSCNLATCRDDLNISTWMLLIAASARVLFYLGFNCSRGTVNEY